MSNYAICTVRIMSVCHAFVIDVYFTGTKLNDVYCNLIVFCIIVIRVASEYLGEKITVLCCFFTAWNCIATSISVYLFVWRYELLYVQYCFSTFCSVSFIFLDLDNAFHCFCHCALSAIEFLFVLVGLTHLFLKFIFVKERILKNMHIYAYICRQICI